ncbi:MAG: hypothetical protein EXX96DRAFT_536483 [Benjaminiella poitrasii]|nr:MAG: hypothetical protein EXX96DRAFT_536483 [Benjaminiella poitrasii]
MTKNLCLFPIVSRVFYKEKRNKSDRQHGHSLEKKAYLKYPDDENHILHRTSTCIDRTLSEQGRTIYPLKLCPQCLVNNSNPLYWNRDVNAAANIRTILVSLILIQDLHSYPEDEKTIMRP